MSHLLDFLRTHLICVHAKEVAWFEFEFTTHNVLIHAAVTVNLDSVDCSLLSFRHSDFKIHRVAVNIHFYRLYAVEHISVIIIMVSNSVFVCVQTFSYVLLVVDVTLVHAKHSVESLGAIDGVAHPTDIAHIIALSFIDVEIHVNCVVAVINYTVRFNNGVSVSQFVIFLYDAVLVLVIVLCDELLSLEQTLEALLISLLQETSTKESSDELLARNIIVTSDIDLVYLHLLILVDNDINNHLVAIVRIITLHNLHLRILESFVLKIVLGDEYRLVHHVRRNLISLDDTYLLLKVFTLAFLHALDVYSGNSRTHCQNDLQEHLVARNTVSLDPYI